MEGIGICQYFLVIATSDLDSTGNDGARATLLRQYVLHVLERAALEGCIVLANICVPFLMSIWAYAYHFQNARGLSTGEGPRSGLTRSVHVSVVAWFGVPSSCMNVCRAFAPVALFCYLLRCMWPKNASIHVCHLLGVCMRRPWHAHSSQNGVHLATGNMSAPSLEGDRV